VTNDLFMRACRREAVERTPVWIMRQAGRYLPSYRALREKVDFLTLCKTPELAAQVTLQPIEALDVDAAIIFSDILLFPEALGMKLQVDESKSGPRFSNPIRTASDIDSLTPADPSKKLKFVMDAIGQTKRELRGRVPLIGFCGSPWTLAAYMVEGKGTKDFRHLKQLVYDQPGLAHKLLAKLADALVFFLEAQLAAGADAIQIFDTWGGILSPDDYREFSLDYIWKLISNVHRNGAPMIVFSKGANGCLAEISKIGADVVGLDWTVDIGEVRRRIGERVALQGNLDPSVLYASPEKIKHEVRMILQKYGNGSGHIFNLGHGILPDTPVDHARALVEAVKEESAVFHR
jgi:uroporphyrinogen decarboxylase